MEKSRNMAFDILRIIAAFSVIMLHVSSRYLMSAEVNSTEFNVANFFDSINRYGVPIFVMISGALFINPERDNDIKRLWIHNILRIFIVYIVWCYGYYIFQSVYLWKFDFWHQNILRTITGIVYASDHLWFLGMLIGLYALSPVINSWIRKASKQNIEYFLFLVVVFEIIRTTFTILMDSSLVSKMSNVFALPELSGYLGYFVFGYYLSNFEVPRKLRISIYCSIPIDVLMNYLISWKMSVNNNGYNPGVYDSFGLFTFLEAIALFMAIVYWCKNRQFRPITMKMCRKIAMDTFGIYLMHVMLLDYLFYEGFINAAVPVLIWEIPIALGVFLITVLLAGAFRRIPYIGRFIC